MNFINIHKYIDLKPIGGYDFKRHLRPIVVFFAMSCATTIYTNLDTIMLGFIKTDADVGYYNAAVKIKKVLVGVVTSLGAVLLPRASYYIKNGQIELFRKMTQRALNFVILLSLPMMLYFIFFAKQGIYFLSGEAYMESILPMQIIMPTLLFVGITNVLGIQVLIPLGLEKKVLYSEIVGALVDLVLNVILIPRLASTGAAIGTVVAEFAVLVVQYRVLKDETGAAFKRVHYGKIVLALLFGSVVSLWVTWMDWGNFTVLSLSAILFFGGYGIALFIMKEPLIVETWHQILKVVQTYFHKA